MRTSATVFLLKLKIGEYEKKETVAKEQCLSPSWVTPISISSAEEIAEALVTFRNLVTRRKQQVFQACDLN